MTDRTVRNLGNLRRSASTARVLNLMRVAHDHGDTSAWSDQPMFRNPTLNRSMILKHRLRRDEIDRFRIRRHVATKIILPIDAQDLRSGGRYLFVDQIGYDRMMEAAFGISGDHPDLKTLAVMNRLPGLDPFLLREQLRRSGIDVAACYFNLSEADMARMTAFVSEEISPLVRLSMGRETPLDAFDLGIDSELSQSMITEKSVSRLASKLLSNAADGDLSALGMTLRLKPEEYEEGIFCWKGFLYYKWVLGGVISEVGPVMDEVRKAKPLGRADSQQHAAIHRGREMVRHRIMATCESTATMLRIYDDAFRSLTEDGRPTAFRDFLLDAPALFDKLGERLGAIQHIVSFWNYRMGPGKPVPTAEELIDLLADFEVSLTGRDDGPAFKAAA